MPEVYFYDLSLWKAMDAARFFSLIHFSSFSSTYDYDLLIGWVSTSDCYLQVV